jgi:hypothetical protein
MTKRNLTDTLKAVHRELMKDVGTSIPGNIIAFDPDVQLAQVQIGIERIDVNGKRYTPPPLIECPVLVPGGKQFIIEHQIDSGDECLIIFSQRCIDGWVNNGGVANNPILRYHSFDDAMVIVGLRSQPGKVTGHANNGVRMRNEAGDKYIWLKNDGTAEITVDTLKINGNIEHDGNTTQTGNNEVTGSVSATVEVSAPQVTGTTDVSFGGISGVGHVHGGVQTGTSNTGGPQ